jgi:DNA polymerase-3 subunit alpha
MAGRKMARFRVEDLRGRVQVTCFPRTYEECRHLIEDGALVVASGKLEEGTDEPAMILNELASLEDALARFTGSLVVHLTPDDGPALTTLQGELRSHPGRQSVFFQVTGSDGQSRRVRAGADFRVRINGELATRIDGLLGRGRVKLARV